MNTRQYLEKLSASGYTVIPREISIDDVLDMEPDPSSVFDAVHGARDGITELFISLSSHNYAAQGVEYFLEQKDWQDEQTTRESVRAGFTL